MRSTPIRRIAALVTMLSLLFGVLAVDPARAADGVVYLTPIVNADDTVTVEVANSWGYGISGCSLWVHDDDLTPTQELVSGFDLAEGQARSWTSAPLMAGFWTVVLECNQGRGQEFFTVDVADFADVPPGTPYYDEIMWLKANGHAQGYPDGTYRPTSPINRDAMAAFLYRMAGSPVVSLPSTSPFTDVPAGMQFHDEMLWLHWSGISTGWTERDGTRTFRPLTPVNRDAMAAFLYRSYHQRAGVPPFQPPATSPFRDVATSNAFYTEIAWLDASGISTGWPDGTFRPSEPINRDAMAAFMFRLHWLIVGTPEGQAAALPVASRS